MANPLKIQTETTPDSLKVMSDADMDYIAHTILADFAATDTGVGTVSVDPVSTTGLTNIGIWYDTSWDVAGGTQLTSYQPSYQAFFGGFTPGVFTDTNVAYAPTEYGAYVSTEDQLTRVSNTFWQDLQAASETLTRPVEYDTTLNRVIQQIDASLNASIMTHTLDRLVAFGLGSYKLEPTMPASGGTWVSKATITDTSNDPTNTSFLWRRSTQTAPTTIRPLKTRLTGNRYNLIEMTDTDIETLTARLRNQIVSTERGKYALQTSAPGVGTWTLAGAAFDDTRSEAYSSTYQTLYQQSYTGFFTSPNYVTFFGGFSSPNYTSNYSQAFTATYTSTYTSPNYVTFFGGFSSPNYTSNYTSPPYTAENYTATSYSGTYISATVSTIETQSLWLRTA